KASEYWSVLELVGDPGRLLVDEPAEVARAAGVDAELADRVERLLRSATAFAFELDEAEQSGLRAVASVDDEYPVVLTERLGRGAPPLLYVFGDPSLLGPALLGIV